MRGVTRTVAVVLTLLHLNPVSSFSQEKHYFFYKPAQARGSDAAFNPLSLLLNGSFDAMRIGTQGTHDLSRYRWGTDARNIWENITDPVARIRAYGWERFRRQELFNLSFDVNSLQFIPNFADHTLGYGMLYAKVTEWYDAHGYPAPIVWGVGTSLVYQYVNEMMQNDGRIYVNVDCIADYDFFNVLGYVLFSFDDVKEFFSETVQLNDWSLQPLYVPRNHHLENVGQEFVMRYKLPFAEQYAPFICWGVNTVAGLSYRYDDANSLSLGIGQAVAGMQEIRRGDFVSATPMLERAVGLFWDNEGSLLAGLIVRGRSTVNVEVNVYPGIVDLYGIKPGLYVGAGDREGLVVGVTFMHIPLSLGFER